MAGVADGSIDIYISTSGGAAGLFPYIQVLDLPYLMSDDRVAEAVLTGTDFTAQTARHGAGRQRRHDPPDDHRQHRRLAQLRQHQEARRKAPADLAGPEDAHRAGRSAAGIGARAVGASPTPIPWPELFTSLQTGVVEGTANGITDIMNMKFPDAGLKYLTLDGHSYMGAFWWMGQRPLHRPDTENSAVVVDGFAALQQATFARPKRKEIQAYPDFKAAGGEIYVPTAEEKAAFKAAVAPVFEWFKTNVKGRAEVLDAFTAAVAEAEAAVAATRAADLN